MTGEAWNEMMHDLAKDERDYLNGPLVSDTKSWCSPAQLWETDNVATYRILKDKCMIEFPNQCREMRFMAEIYFVSFCLIVTFMVLNLVIAVILDGYEDGKGHAEEEVIDACIKMWKKYDDDYTMFIPFQDAFRYADEVLREFSKKAAKKLQMPSVLRPHPGGCCGVDLACVDLKYAQAFDLQMTEDGKVHFIPVVKLVLRMVFTNDDPEIMKEIEEADSKLAKKDKDRLEKMEAKQLLKNRAVLSDCLSLQTQVAASKIQRRYKTRQAQRMARNDIERRRSRNEEEPLVAVSFASTPGQGSASAVGENLESRGDGQGAPSASATSATSASASATPDGRRLEPRSPANVDGLDEPGRWRMVRPADEHGAEPRDVLRLNGLSAELPGNGIVQPPPGG